MSIVTNTLNCQSGDFRERAIRELNSYIELGFIPAHDRRLIEELIQRGFCTGLSTHSEKFGESKTTVHVTIEYK